MAGEASPAAVATPPAGCLSSSGNSNTSKESSPAQQPLNSSVDSGIAVLETETPTLRRRQRLQQCHRILQVLQRDHLNHQQLRDRLSKLANKKWRKEESAEDHSCNVCCADLDLGSAKNYVTCRTCGKSVCRGLKCADWRPKDASWECQLCQSSKESLAHTSSWVAEQMSFNQHKFVYPMRARSEVYIPIAGDGNDSSMQFESVSQIGLPANSDDRAKIREYVEEIVAEMLGGNLDHIKVGQLSKSENYLQLFDKFHAKLSNLLINVENSLSARALQGDLPAIVNGHHNGAGNASNNNINNNNNNGDSELADISQTRLRSLIETIIAETLRSSSLSASGAVSEISLDTRSQLGTAASELANGNGLKRRHRTEHYFEPKIYQDLLATAVLNKIADKEGNTRLLAESTPDLSGRHIDENFNAEALSTTSGSSIEPRSDCSLTDHEIVLDNGKSQALQGDLERESVLSDYIAAHMVPLPDFSASVTESEDDIGSISSSMIGDGNWEDNWLFKKKRSSVTPSSTGMLVPAPKENVRAQIGDKTADEVSDLSEMGSDAEDSSLDLLRSNELNDRLLSKHLIGGQNTKFVLDELVDRTSLTSHTLPEEHEPAFTETTNAFVVSPPAVPTVPTVPPPPMIFQDDSLNEELGHTPIAAQGETEELASLDGCTGFSTVEYIDEEQMHGNVPSVIEILAAMALGPMLAVPASEQPGAMTPSEMHTLKELSDLALAEINGRKMDLVHHHSLDIIEEENTDPAETAQCSSVASLTIEEVAEPNSLPVELPATVEESESEPPASVGDAPEVPLTASETPLVAVESSASLEGVLESESVAVTQTESCVESTLPADSIAEDPPTPVEIVSETQLPTIDPVEAIPETELVNMDPANVLPVLDPQITSMDSAAPVEVLPETQPTNAEAATIEETIPQAVPPCEVIAETQAADMEPAVPIEVLPPASVEVFPETQPTDSEALAPVDVLSEPQFFGVAPGTTEETIPKDVSDTQAIDVIPEPQFTAMRAPAAEKTIHQTELVAVEPVASVEVVSETQAVDIEPAAPLESLKDLEPPAPVEVPPNTIPTDVEPPAPTEVLPETQPSKGEPLAPIDDLPNPQSTDVQAAATGETIHQTELDALPPVGIEPAVPLEVLSNNEPPASVEVLPETQPEEPPTPIKVLSESQSTDVQAAEAGETIPQDELVAVAPVVREEVASEKQAVDIKPAAPLEIINDLDLEPPAPVEVPPNTIPTDVEPPAPTEVLPETQPSNGEPLAPIDDLPNPQSTDVQAAAAWETIPQETTPPEEVASETQAIGIEPAVSLENLPNTQVTDEEHAALIDGLPDSQSTDVQAAVAEETIPQIELVAADPVVPTEIMSETQTVDINTAAALEILPEMLPDRPSDEEPLATKEELPEIQPSDVESPAPTEVLPETQASDLEPPASLEVLPETQPEEPPAPILPDSQTTNVQAAAAEETIPQAELGAEEPVVPVGVVSEIQAVDTEPLAPLEVLNDLEHPVCVEVLPDTQPADVEPPPSAEVLPDTQPSGGEPAAPIDDLPDSQSTEVQTAAAEETIPQETIPPEEVASETQAVGIEPAVSLENLPNILPPAPVKVSPDTQLTDVEPPAPTEVLPETQGSDEEPLAPVEIPSDLEPPASLEALPGTQPAEPAAPILSDSQTTDLQAAAAEETIPQTELGAEEPFVPGEVVSEIQAVDTEPLAPLAVLNDLEPPASAEVLPETQPEEPAAPIDDLPDSQSTEVQTAAAEETVPQTELVAEETIASVAVVSETQAVDIDPAVPSEEPPAPIEVLPESQPSNGEPAAPINGLPDSQSTAATEETIPQAELGAEEPVVPAEVASETHAVDILPAAPLESLKDLEPPSPVEVPPDTQPTETEPSAPTEVLPETQPSNGEPPAPLEQTIPQAELVAVEPAVPVKVTSETQAVDVLSAEPSVEVPDKEHPASTEDLPKTQLSDVEPLVAVEDLPEIPPTNVEPPTPVEVLPDLEPPDSVEVLPEIHPVEPAAPILPNSESTDMQADATEGTIHETQVVNVEPAAPLEILPDVESSSPAEVHLENQSTDLEFPAPVKVLLEPQSIDVIPTAAEETIPQANLVAEDPVVPGEVPSEIQAVDTAPLEVRNDLEPTACVEVLPETHPEEPAAPILPDSQTTDVQAAAAEETIPQAELGAEEPVVPVEVASETQAVDIEPAVPIEVLPDVEPQSPPENTSNEMEPPSPVEVLPDLEPPVVVEALSDTQAIEVDTQQPTISEPPAHLETQTTDVDPPASADVVPETQPEEPTVLILPDSQSTDVQAATTEETIPQVELVTVEPASETQAVDIQPTENLEVLPDKEPPPPIEDLPVAQPTDVEPPAPIELPPEAHPEEPATPILPDSQSSDVQAAATEETIQAVDIEPTAPLEILPDVEPPPAVEVLPEPQSIKVTPAAEEEIIPQVQLMAVEPVAPEEVASEIQAADIEPAEPVEILPDLEPPAPMEVLPEPQPIDEIPAAAEETIPQAELMELISEAQSTNVSPVATEEEHSTNVVPATTEVALGQAEIVAVEPLTPVGNLPKTQTDDLKLNASGEVISEPQSKDEEPEFVEVVSETQPLDVEPSALSKSDSEKLQLVSKNESAVEPEEITQQTETQPPVEAVPEAQPIAVPVEAQALQELIPETVSTPLEPPEEESVVPETQDKQLPPSEPPKSIPTNDEQLTSTGQETPGIYSTEPENPALHPVSETNAPIDSAKSDGTALGKAPTKCLRRQPNIPDTAPSDGKSESLNLLGTICKFYIKDKRLLATIERRRRRSLIMHKYLSSFDSMDETIDDESCPSLFEELNEDSLASSELKPPTERAATPTSEADPSYMTLDSPETETDLVDKVEADEPQNNPESHLIYPVESEANAVEEPLIDKATLHHIFSTNDQLESHLNHLEGEVTDSDYSAATRLDMASQTSCDMPDDQDVETDSRIVFSLSDITYNFINEILFSDQLSTESHYSDESEPSTACETFNGDGDTEQEFVSQRVLVLDKHRPLNTNPSSSHTLHSNLHLPLTQTNTTPSGSRRTNGKLTNGSLRWSGGHPTEPPIGGPVAAPQDDVAVDDDVVLLRRFVPGSIAEREVKKWYNAVEMPNNPYAPEALKQRISGTQERYMDVPNISPSAEQKALASALTENPDPPSPQTDYKRYSRDYYINNAPSDSTVSARAPASSSNSNLDLQRNAEDVEDIVINEAQKASQAATEQEQPQPESVYKALPVQVLDESLDSQSSPSLHSLQTTATTTSDESDTVRIYDFNKQETTVIRAAPAPEQQQPPSSSTTSSMESAQSASPSVSSIDSSVSKKRERPVVLQFGPGDSAPTVGSPVGTPTRGSTPPAFRFLQPKRRLIDPSQVLSVDEDDVPEPTTPVAERPVIEVEVGHAMPSVKALAQAFLLTSKRTQPQRRWRQVKLAGPPGTPATSLTKRHRLEHAVSMAEVADESTIASDLSSLETDPSTHSDDNPPIASPASPVPVRHGFLRSNIAFFENLKFK